MKTVPTKEPVESQRLQLIERLRAALQALEDGDEAVFSTRFDALVRLREESLFAHVARLTRALHDEVLAMRLDTRLSQLAGDEMPDARHRLDYVIRMTETAAHRTLDLVEQARSVPTRMTQAAAQLSDAAALLRTTPSEAAAIAQRLDEVRASLQGDALQLRTTLSELAQAQEYQDITGQLIKRVITLVCNVESALLELLRAAGGGLQAASARPISALSEPPGPVLPGSANAAAAADQHDADELLASLGF